MRMGNLPLFMPGATQKAIDTLTELNRQLEALPKPCTLDQVAGWETRQYVPSTTVEGYWQPQPDRPSQPAYTPLPPPVPPIPPVPPPEPDVQVGDLYGYEGTDPDYVGVWRVAALDQGGGIWLMERVGGKSRHNSCYGVLSTDNWRRLPSAPAQASQAHGSWLQAIEGTAEGLKAALAALPKCAPTCTPSTPCYSSVCPQLREEQIEDTSWYDRQKRFCYCGECEGFQFTPPPPPELRCAREWGCSLTRSHR